MKTTLDTIANQKLALRIVYEKEVLLIGCIQKRNRSLSVQWVL